MSVRYETIIDEVSRDDAENLPERPEIYFIRMANMQGKRWPKAIGIVQILVGFLISFLGILEVLVIPISEDHTAGLQLNKHTCYGAGIWAGLVMVLTGSTGIRASLSKRKTTVYRFYNLSIVTLILYMALTAFLIAAYSMGWTTEDAYGENSRMHQVHMMVTIFVVLGLLFALTAVVQYYDVICCGELKLWRWWLDCLCCRSLRDKKWQSSGSNTLDWDRTPALIM